MRHVLQEKNLIAPMSIKKKQRHERLHQVLIGLVKLHLKSGRPIGSNTLKENGFDDLSSATIRNYFAKLEQQGLLIQQHSSGGRLPSPEAYRLYAKHFFESHQIEKTLQQKLKNALEFSNREIAGYLYQATETISELSSCAAFLASPRFDQDFIVDIKLVGIDHKRILCVLITDFGLVHTETLYSNKRVTNFSLKRMESYFRFRMTGLDKPTLSEEEEALAAQFYNEILLRHIVGYSNFNEQDIYKTGFSQLLAYPELREASALANGLALFENTHLMRSLLSQGMQAQDIQYWIGDEIPLQDNCSLHCSVIAVPYFIHQKPVGAIALLGPNRVDYAHLFGLCREFSKILSEKLTESLYKFKISYRQPKQQRDLAYNSQEAAMLGQVQYLSLEDQTKHYASKGDNNE